MSAPAVGSVIGGRFRIDQILGAGGMGIVVAATHLELAHRVAIKFLHDEMAASPTIVERFLREARAVVSLRTEHVCRVTDVGRTDSGAPYIVMELLDGSDLQRAVMKQPLPVTTAVEYVMQACIALAEAHRAGIIHRDLKPANLFVTRRLDGGPLVKVLDFGIAKALAETGAQLTQQAAMGSPGYMSPEQLQSARDVDVRTDIWALGVTLYQLLAGRLPFAAATATEIAIRVANDPPDPLDVDAKLHAIISRCLDKDRTRRYADVADLCVELAPFGGPAGRRHVAEIGQIAFKTLVDPAPIAVVVPSAPTAASVVVPRPVSEAPPPPPRRRTWPIVLVSLVVLAGAAAGIVFYPKRGAKPEQVAQVTRDAEVVTTTPPPPPPPPPVADAGDPWQTPDATPADASLVDAAPPPDARRERVSKEKVYTLEEMAAMTKQMQGMDLWAKACEQMTRPPGITAAPPLLVAKCFCRKKDQVDAKKAYDRLTRDAERADVRARCAQLGVTLPE